MSTSTPSLSRRVIVLGTVGVALALVVVNAGLHVALRAGLVASAEAPDAGALLGLQVVVSLLALALAAVLLWLASRVVMRPVDEVAAAASRTSAGPQGERLHPDRPHTELGRMALAFDEMLDRLEAGFQVAAQLERRSGTFETRWRQVLEAAQEAYVAVEPTGIVVDLNRRAEQLFEGPREYFCGRSAAEMVPLPYRADVVRAVAEIAANGLPSTGAPYELEALTRSGRCFPVECTVWSVDRRGGTVVHAFVRDITERRDAQLAGARFAAVIESSSDAIVTEDLHGRVRTWNRAAERIFGWTAEHAVGRHVSFLVPEDELQQHLAALEQISRGKAAVDYEGECLTRGGTTVPVSIRLSPVHDQRGAVAGVSAVIRDITEQRWLSRTLDDSLAALQVAVDEARGAEESTRRFLADAAHQLRTPIAGIRACAETLLRPAEPEDADRLLVTMVRETSRAAELISTLLHIARLDQALPVRLEPVDVVALCAHEVERLSLLSPGLVVDLEAQEAPETPLLLDRAGCQELLSNLGDNARRHAASRIAISLSAWESSVLICVADDGPGVREEDRERVFERFVTLDGRGGSGLGLSIVQSLARSMGGDARFDSGFVVELPATPADDEGTTSPTPSSLKNG